MWMSFSGCYCSARISPSPGLLLGLVLLFPLLFANALPRLKSPNFLPEPPDFQQAAALPAAPSPQQVSPPVLQRSPMRFALLRKLYQCADGVQVIVAQEKGAVRLTLNGEVFHLNQVSSNASATKYSLDTITWTLENDTGTLEDATKPSNPTFLAQNCRQQSVLPAASANNTIQGTVNFPHPGELASAAEVRIELLDVASPGEPHKSIAAIKFTILDRKPPIPFELAFDRQKVHSSDCCALSAQVLVNGKLRDDLAEPVAIPDITHPPMVTLELAPAARKAAQP
jgi:uncharacterized lipoprotein YbaY